MGTNPRGQNYVNGPHPPFANANDTKPVPDVFDAAVKPLPLTPDTDYTVLVQAGPQDGALVPVAESEVTSRTPLKPPSDNSCDPYLASSDPTSYLTTVEIDVAPSEAGDALVVKWDEVSSTYGHGDPVYDVHWWVGEGRADARSALGITELTYEIEGLTPGDTYTVRVYARKVQYSWSGYENYLWAIAHGESTGRIIPPLPGLTVTSNNTGTALIVSWDAFPGAINYTVQWKSDGQGYGPARAATVTSTSHTITGLDMYTAYTVQVQAATSTVGTAAQSEFMVPPRAYRPPFQYLEESCEPVPLAADGTFNGRWSDDPDCPSALTSKSVSRFYRFTLPEGKSGITFTLEGGGPRAFMRLYPEWTNNWVAVGDAEDPMEEEYLTPGVYYLEVENGFKRGSTGEFRITMSGLDTGPAGLTCAETFWTFTGSGGVQGRWDSGCSGTTHYHRQYDLRLTETRVVTIGARASDPNANPDPGLLLLRRFGRSAVLVEENEGSGGVTRISRTLTAGDYYINLQGPELNQSGSGGSFTLDVRVEPLPEQEAHDDETTDTSDSVADSAPRVSDKSQFTTHHATVGEAFSITLPTADAGSGNGGPYEYILWKRGGDRFGENGLSFNARTRTLSGTPAAEGTHLLAYQVHDADGNRAKSDSFVEETYLEIVVSAVAVGDSGPQEGLNGQELPPPPNTLPSFDLSLVTALTVPENSPAGTSVGAPVAATDPDADDTLTYSLSGDDAASFSIDGTGQMTTIANVTYDYERRSYLAEPAYLLTVEVSDGNGGAAIIPVTVTLTDVDDAPAENLPPEFHEGTSTTREVPEGSPGGTNVGAPITAFDANKDALSYLFLDGADGAAFSLDPDTGQLTTIDGVTHDRAAKSSYQFMVIVGETDTDLGYLTGIWVTVTLTEADTTTTTDTAPTVADTSKFKTHYATVGQAFSLELPTADADSGNGGPYAYSLLNRSDGTAFGTNGLSFGASTRTLSGTPTAEATHELSYLIHDSDTNKAKSDAFVEETKLKVVVLPGGNAVGQQGAEPANRAPSFDADVDITLSVDENSAAGTKVGSAFTATDPDSGDTLAYSLSGDDAAAFNIGALTGQIATKVGETYNYEAKSSYSLTVVVSDSGGLTDSINVTVSLDNVAEAPTVSDATQFKNHAATVGQAFSLVLPAADANSGDGGPYEYLLWHRGEGRNFMDQAINGLSFNAATRTLSGTPEAAGVWKLSYVVHDDDGDRSEDDRFRARTDLQVTVSE